MRGLFIDSIAPVTRPLFLAALSAWERIASLGMHPGSPDYGKHAIRRANWAGGVRIR